MLRHIAILALLLQPTLLLAGEAKFEKPVRLTAGTELINDTGKMLYPTPVLIDVDNDKRLELVIGDLWGNLFVAENTNSSNSGDPVWAPLTKLKGANSKALKLNNW